MEMSQRNSLYSHLKPKCLFAKMKNKKIKQVMPGCSYQWEQGGYKERVKEAECTAV
jgi:hypothetical protein